MNRIVKVVIVAALLAPAITFAAQAKKYQATGKVLELTETMIVIDKGDEKWEIARDANTKVTGDLKVGGKVTVQYRMTATDVEVKGEKAPAKK
ncbi:MAG: hypothetical protein WCS70_10205 [Verrucomicrobiota bacterium]